jgi:hypothetical protein
MYAAVAMSATTHADDAVRECSPDDATPVTIDADDLASTAPEYLRDLKYDLAEEGYVPARVETTACFDEDCSLATQDEADRIRDVVRAASFLGVSTLELDVEAVADAAKVQPAVDALAERARREGVSLVVTDADGVAV